MEMMIVYDSRTGNVERFVKKLELESKRVCEGLIINCPFVLVTYTNGFGQVPESTSKFLEINHGMLKAVAASGNRNWGSNFAKSADIISEKYNVPVLLKFELAGTNKDVHFFTQEVTKIANEHS